MGSIQKRIGKDGKVSYRGQIRPKELIRRGIKTPTLSKTSPSKTEIKNWIQETEASIRDGSYFKNFAGRKKTVGELIDRYVKEILPKKPKSLKKQSMQLSWWKSKIGGCFLNELVPDNISECKEELLVGEVSPGIKRSPSTVNRYLAALSHVFSVGVKEYGWIDFNPVSRIFKPKEGQGRTRFLGDEERNRLLQACKESSNPYLYTIVVIAISTGMRQSEMLNLRWSNIDFINGRAILEETKNGDTRAVPIVGLSMDLLKKLYENKTMVTDLIFPSLENPTKPTTLFWSWRRALESSGIESLRFHDLRHTAASYLARNGASLPEIGAVLGHRSVSTTKRYTHLTESHIAGIVASMNKDIFG